MIILGNYRVCLCQCQLIAEMFTGDLGRILGLISLYHDLDLVQATDNVIYLPYNYSNLCCDIEDDTAQIQKDESKGNSICFMHLVLALLSCN